MTECKIEENKTNCNCSYPCSRKGLCCECLIYHKSRGEVPACFFPDEVERTYNRSIENFIRVNQEKR
ncbi:MAG: hypothetical protein KAR55_03585 [Thermoplasmatales archaeon]|nr:hypothetical protein [Thermoplasmatales archaeon]